MPSSGRGGQDVVELSVVLVVGDDHQGVVPDVLVALERLEDLVHVALAVHRVEARVLAPRGGHHHPGDLGERVLGPRLAGRDQVPEDGVEVRLGVVVGRGGALVDEGVGLPDLAGARFEVGLVRRAGVERGEAVGDVAAVLADEAVLEAAADAVAAVVGVDPPVDAGLLELFGDRRPGAGVVVLLGVGGLAAARTGHQVVAVGDGRPVHRAEVHVADRVVGGQRVHPRHVVGRVVPHAVVTLVLHPGVPPPAVGTVEVVLVAPGGGRHGGRHDGAGGVALLEDGGAVLELQDLLVVVSAHTAQLAEVVVEGPVLLHQDHHVLQIGYVAVVALGEVVLGRTGLRAADRLGDRACGDRAEADGGRLQHPAPRDAEFACVLDGGAVLGVGTRGLGRVEDHQGHLWGRVIRGGGTSARACEN